ncbi:MAG: arginase [Candidatus Sericytochromatia bacterium]|nr:arginase [Candidatus Sericytochromatia bacterium]
MRHVRIIGVPLDLGAGRRGCDMGPSALRIAGIKQRLQAIGHTVSDADIPVGIPEHLAEQQSSAKYLSEIVRVTQATADEVEETILAGQFPLIIGGDHSVAIGTIAGLAKAYRTQGKKLGVIWVDAHADMNTPGSSPSGNIHGMPLAVNLGIGSPELCSISGDFQKLDPKNVALIGIRNLDIAEQRIVRESGVHAFTMGDIDRIGMAAIMDKVLGFMKEQVDVIHISFDLDGLDPFIAPGVGTPVEGGLTYREAHLLMEMVAASGMMCSMEVVEDNPVLDIRNQTANLAAELIESGFGKVIL